MFSFFHLVLGDDEGHLREECRTILERIRNGDSAQFRWDDYYKDRQARQVYWQVLIRIAVLFKRWDLRKDWFLKLMQYSPTTNSLGSMAFQLRDVGDHDALAPAVFGEGEFKRLFHALFDGFARLTPIELAEFQKEYGAEASNQIEAVLNKLSQPSA